MIRKLLLILVLTPNYTLADIVATSLNETYSDTVKVSGEFLVGVQLEATSEQKRLHVNFPESTTGNLCIVLSSIDGKYKANLSYTLTTPQSGLKDIGFVSEHPKVLMNYSTQEIAVSASLKESCVESFPSKSLVASWNKETKNNLILLIRSDARKDTAYIPNFKNKIAHTKCKKIRSSYNVSYDKYCKFENIDINSINEIEIIRKNLQSIEPEKIYFHSPL